MITRSSFHALALAALAHTAPAYAGEHPFETDALRKPAFKTGGTCVIRNVVIHSAVAPATRGDVYVKDGRIAAVGKVSAPAGISRSTAPASTSRLASSTITRTWPSRAG